MYDGESEIRPLSVLVHKMHHTKPSMQVHQPCGDKCAWFVTNSHSTTGFVTLMSPLQEAMSDSSPQESTDLNFGQAQRLDFSAISLVPLAGPIGLENVFNFANGDVSYLAEELAMLLAPCGKRLWEARNREA